MTLIIWYKYLMINSRDSIEKNLFFSFFGVRFKILMLFLDFNSKTNTLLCIFIDERNEKNR